MRRIVLVPLVGLVLAGCGGSKQASLYTLAPTKECTRTVLGVTDFAPTEGDFVASTASGGSLRVHLADNAVTVLFAADGQEATNLADAYVRFHAKNVGVQDVLRTENNAVLLWQLHPSADDENKIHDCLK